MISSPSYWAVVPAAGIGRRMGGSIPKQYLPLLDVTVIEHALQPLLDQNCISRLVVCLSPEDDYWPSLLVAQHPKVITVEGGHERCHSVMNGLKALENQAAEDDWVLVHDAARPCLRSSDLDSLIEQIKDDPVGGILATPVHDTVKLADESKRVKQTVDRVGLWRAYTPQMFRYGRLKQSLSRALLEASVVTDEATALESQGYQPRLIEGHSDNIKVTCPEDLQLAEFYLSSRR